MTLFYTRNSGVRFTRYRQYKRLIDSVTMVGLCVVPMLWDSGGAWRGPVQRPALALLFLS